MATMLTSHDMQQRLQVDRSTIYRMAEAGRLPALRVGKQWRFPADEIERWLGDQRPEAKRDEAYVQAPATPPGPATADPLPPCVQLIQDVVGDILGVMVVITDMAGRPLTAVSNPCGFFTALAGRDDALDRCVDTWHRLAAVPDIQPQLVPSETGLLCGRGLIRSGSELTGMLVVGGIAPEAWPPDDDVLAAVAETFGVPMEDACAHAEEVYRLGPSARVTVLESVQRVADIISHIGEDRRALLGRLTAIGALSVPAPSEHHGGRT
jgi:excisionase family DNA binding protein